MELNKSSHSFKSLVLWGTSFLIPPFVLSCFYVYRTRVELKLTEIFPISQSFQKHLTAHVHKARIHLSTDDVYMHSTVCCHLLKNLQELCSVCSTYNITIQILLARISAHITMRNKLQYTEMHKWHHMCRDTLKHTHTHNETHADHKLQWNWWNRQIGGRFKRHI